ncbi:helix-turn-helix domain-containing protein [Oscillospiraceae bacterium 50-58]
MKTANAKIVPFGALGNGPLADEAERQGLPRMKTIKEMMALTGLSYTMLRNLCLENKIVHIRAGKKYLINYDRFADYLNGVSGA